ncbi:MAG: LacI family DNA-binding transcriptional regulator [Bacilli bacterium]|nr:LacI family DNA-binding transcriptional regulator [Bacilli bacterium]MBN2696994.1 LacI family DNA-binding transcriptional regulator [Bacilli bacterium]
MATIKDVAKKAHVSVATVSRVINNKGYVNDETKTLVLNAIEELQYVPNELARSLFKKQSRIIGVIVPHMTSYYFAELLEIIENYTIEYDYHIMVCNSQDDEARETKFIRVFQQYSIDGIIIIANTTRIGDYQNLNIPIITIDHKLSDQIPSVSSNNLNGGKLAAEKLASTGCKNILHLRGPSPLITVQARSKGFEQQLAKHGLACRRFDLEFKSPSKDYIQNFIDKNPDADGIFCDSDLIAMHVIQCLKHNNKSVPEDVQVIGFDNIELASIFSPKLTTIAQDKHTIGKYAVETLVKLIAKTELTQKHHQVDVALIERETTRAN